MTKKRSNQENQHTNRKLTEETSLPSSTANSDMVEPTTSNDEEVPSKDKELLQEEAELAFDEESKSDEKAMATAKELDQLDKDVSESIETGEATFEERDTTTVSAEETTEQELAESAEQNLSDGEIKEVEEPPVNQEGTQETVAVVEASQESEEETREEKRKKRRREKKPRLRLIPIWLRILISILLIGGSLILGMLFGYGVIGGGESVDVLKPDTWYHIIDIIRGN
ncbi:DNA-directed RNA polymerase subunit beta [Alkalihalobacillus deserti]|uniref:DNA-directed RNA polymerase subunit beta n=1 Tax=Alkalihalobacillus deserti TaxID=2879466 RepID=UPI001D134ED1|nr:DNA-directed RNA polymerase subunit beta [Alkalihalobacillus deserti]